MDDQTPAKIHHEKFPEAIGPYKILDTLGQGGMAYVYKAQSSDGQIYALKIVKHKDAMDPDTWKRFSREISVLSQLNHPNIISIHDVGEWQNRPYFVMDCIEGHTLDFCLQNEGKISEKKTLSIIIQIARSLNSVHELEILHRDIKPSNILVEKNKAFLMDFGIGCYYTGGSRITRTGTIVGTPNYMPPEQAQGEWENMGPWSDIYALGLTLFHLLTGVLPFKGKSDVDVLINLNHKPLPSARKYTPAISAETERIIQKSAKKDPKDRYQTIDEFVIDLENAIKGESAVKQKNITRKSTVKKRRRAPEKSSSSQKTIIISTITILLISILVFIPWTKETKSKKNTARKVNRHKKKRIKNKKKNGQKYNKKEEKNPIKPIITPNNHKAAQVPDSWPLFPSEQDIYLTIPPEIKAKLLRLEKNIRFKNSQKKQLEVSELLEWADLHRRLKYYRKTVEILHKIPNKNSAVLRLIAENAMAAKMNIYADFYLWLLQKKFPDSYRQETALRKKEIEKRIQKLIHSSDVRAGACAVLADLRRSFLADVEKQKEMRDQLLQRALNSSKDCPEFRPWIRALRITQQVVEKKYSLAQQEFQLLLQDNQAISDKKQVYWRMGATELNMLQGFFYMNQEQSQSQAKQQYMKVLQSKVDNQYKNWAKLHIKTLKIPYQKRNLRQIQELSFQCQTIFMNIMETRSFYYHQQAINEGRNTEALRFLIEFLFLESGWFHLGNYKTAHYYWNHSKKISDPVAREQVIKNATYYFTRSKLLQPGFNDPVYHLGTIAWSLGQNEQAERFFRYCLKNPPQWSPKSQENIRQFFDKKNK